MITSPETHHTPSAEIPDELKGLSLEHIEQMRNKQLMELRTATHGMSMFSGDEYKTARDETYADFDTYRNDLLNGQNIAEDDPKREEYLEYLRSLSIDKIPDKEWHVGPLQPDGTNAPSGRDRAQEAFTGLVKNVNVAPIVNQEGAVKDVKENVEKTRKEFSKLISERTTKIFESKTKSAEIDASYEEFTDMLSALATEMMFKLDAEGADEATRNKAIADFTREEIDKATKEIEATRAAAYEDRSPRMKKFLNKWASWGGDKKFFSKKRFMGNIKKGALFALPAAGLATLAAPVLGAVGAGIGVGVGVGAVAGLVGRSIARKFASNKLDDTANATTIAQAQAAEMTRRMDLQKNGEEQADMHSLLDVVKERSQSYRRRNGRRIMSSTAIALTVGVLSPTAADMLHDATDGMLNKAGDWISDKFSDTKRFLEIDQDGNYVDKDGNVVRGGGRDIDDPGRTSDRVIAQPSRTELPSNFSPDAYQVHRGEGWISQLKDIDPTMTNAEVQDKLIKLLETKDPEIKKWVYEYTNPDGTKEPRLPRSGKMPESVLKSVLKL